MLPAATIRRANLRRIALRVGVVMLAFGIAVLAVAATRSTGPAKKPAPVLSPYDLALQMRAALETTPAATRTRNDYAEVMGAFRTIYHGNPADGHAPASIYAVAELLAEQGRNFNDAKSMQSAVGQFEFLRKQYPQTGLRMDALLSEAQIEQNDLQNAKAAREKYAELLKLYPKSEQATEAKTQLAAMKSGKAVVASAKAGSSASSQNDNVVAIQNDKATTGPSTARAAHASLGMTNTEADSSAALGITNAKAGSSAAPQNENVVVAKNGKTVAATPAHEAELTADGKRSLTRALGLKIGRIVIDAGHGGHDSGTLGVDGLQEKMVVLDVALRLGKLLKDRLGAEVIYTRDTDNYIPLETRTAIANKAQADLFISIHANSSTDASARGVETYYLNFTSDAGALEVAARENAVSDQGIHQLADLVKQITLKDKIDESREFAADVEQSLYGGLASGNAGLKNRGTKKAPFVVLIGANMPSILAEISFVTNPKDARQLRDPKYRQRVAESLYRGVAKYESGLSGIRPAEKQPVEKVASVGSHTTGQ
jgi:N-acetylmuramoyl-L-alanine amidase